jgi:acyl-coenzyme A thioesterase PaaI-like protein
MAVDDRGLVHGGFVFGLADHAAMLAVNDPNVVLGAASTRFLKPVRVGEDGGGARHPSAPRPVASAASRSRCAAATSR